MTLISQTLRSHVCLGYATHTRGSATSRVECTKCNRRGRYNVRKLIEKYGRKGNMSKWMSDLKGDCPKRETPELRSLDTPALAGLVVGGSRAGNDGVRLPHDALVSIIAISIRCRKILILSR
jgi:hypothetical protein